MDLPVNFLSVLKCCTCEGYLSCGPIYIFENGQATCGPCSNKSTETNLQKTETVSDGVSRIRNTHYENLASIFQFPCKFAPFGCPEKILFSEGPPYPHTSCIYEPYACPILLNDECDWRGPWHQLVEHCEQAHPDNILENFNTSEPNFAEDSVKTYIIPCFNTLFLLCIKISVVSERIVHSVFLLDDPSKISLYSFYVDCKRNSLTFSKSGKIGTVDDFVNQKSIFCIISRPFLLTKLGGVAGTTFTINIKQISRTVKCKFCCAEIDNCEALEWICNNCTVKLHYCQNKNWNCHFTDINLEKVKKHERYFCKYIVKCFDCSGDVNAGKVFQHFDSSAHENTICSKVGLRWKAIETPKRTLKYVLLNSRVVDKMFCKYYLDARQMSIILCTTYSSDQLSLYKCTIEVYDKETMYHEVFVPNLVEDYFWDWRVDIDFDFSRNQNETVELDIKINFDKIS